MSTKYIPPQKQHTLKEFKYSGGTDSILYQYLWSPFAQYLLKYFPLWVAPNVITLFALLVLLICHIIFMLPDDNNKIPNWKLIMLAVSLIIYQHLDNIDGKQARRTKSSSPLGMLFDHGSDAISAFLISSQVLKMLDVPYYFRIFTLFGFIMLVYFVAMWSQYSVGYFKLGRVNPVDQGLPAYSIFALLATQKDLSIFREQHIYGTYGQQIIYMLVFLLIPVFYFMSRDILRKAIRPFKQIIIVPLLYFVTGFTLYSLYIAQPTLSPLMFHCLFYAMLSMWARNMILIQFQFITHQIFVVFNIGTNCFLFFVWLYIGLLKFGINIPENAYFLCMAISQVLILLEMCVGVMREGSRILGIRIFSLEPRNKEQ